MCSLQLYFLSFVFLILLGIMILHCVFRWASIFPISFGGVPDLLVFLLLLLLLLIFNESLLLTKYKIKIMFFFFKKANPLSQFLLFKR